MKYKYRIIWIVGTEKNYRKRVYIVSKSELESLRICNTFVLRESITGQKIYRSCKTDSHYMINN